MDLFSCWDVCCVASATTRPNWREERKLNVETFGARSASQFSRRGGYRGIRGRGGRGLRGAPNRGNKRHHYLILEEQLTSVIS